MRINQILTEQEQRELEEGPLDAIGSVAKGVGKVAGKVAGGIAKGVGAVAGAYGGIKKAFGAGKQAATDYIGNVGTGTNVDVGDEDPAAAPAAAPAAPAAAPSGGGGAAPAVPPTGGATPPTTQQINQQGPKGTAPAKAQTGVAAQALQKTAQGLAGASTEKAGQTMYAQVKANIDKLDKKGKQRILQLLQL